MSRDRLLFILNHRQCGTYGSWSYSIPGQPLSSGLANSVRFLIPMLEKAGIEAKWVEVQDNNRIDREVTKYRPTHCIIEAFWVVPEKFDVLMPLHPNVTWIVRNHSKVEFLANEGIAFGWIVDYLKRGVFVASNSEDTFMDLHILAKDLGLPTSLLLYLPNHYPLETPTRIPPRVSDGMLDVGCFGAIRPLKNQMNQAIASIGFANELKLSLNFHVNANRVEGGGEQIIKNLRQLFIRLPKHRLWEHEWLNHDDFLMLVRGMDLMSQVSFSETFNIVSADAVSQNVPVIGSSQVSWLPEVTQADPNSIEDIWAHYNLVYRNGYQEDQRRGLQEYNRKSRYTWLSQFK